MRRTIGTPCVLIVGLQVLIGVPALICLVLFALLHGGLPIAAEVHVGQDAAAAALIPPPLALQPPMAAHVLPLQPRANRIPQDGSLSTDNPILTSRAEHGSPLTGTILGENMPADVEERLFLTALEKVAAETVIDEVPAPVNQLPPTLYPNPSSGCSTSQNESADRFAIEHLYALADSDERAGKYDRADRWRALARDIRSAPQPAEITTVAADRTDSAAK